MGEVGGKTASLGELYGHKAGAWARVPNGFALTATADRQTLTAAGAWPRLHALPDKLDVTHLPGLAHGALGLDWARAAGAATVGRFSRSFPPLDQALRFIALGDNVLATHPVGGSATLSTKSCVGAPPNRVDRRPRPRYPFPPCPAPPP